MSDELIIEYLHERGRTGVPIGFVASVMSAVDEAPMARSPFGFSLPVLTGTAFVGVVIAVALSLVLGSGRPVGPAPSAAPSATTSAGTVEELEFELAAAVDALRVAPGVRGQQTEALTDALAVAVWFDWRSNGDYVVVQRNDLDVIRAGSATVTGEGISTSIFVLTGDRFLFSAFATPGSTPPWQNVPRDQAPPVVTLGTGLLAGESDPADPTKPLTVLSSMPDIPTGSIERRLDADGRVTWTAETLWRGGTAIQRWQIAPNGMFRSWTFDLVGATLDPNGEFEDNVTSMSLEFEALTDPRPIFVPDLADEPDPADFGLPDDFPLPAVTSP